MSLDTAIKKSVCEYAGERFYLSEYQGETYLSEFVNGIVMLCTESKLNKESYFDCGCFWTSVKIKNLDDLFRAKMYITYKGNEYAAVIVERGMEKVVLQARKGMEDEDIKLGFVWDAWERTTWKTITRDEIEDIRIEKTSVYDEFLQKYGNRY